MEYLTITVFMQYSQIFNPLTEHAQGTSLLMIDATYLKAHRTTASLRKKGYSPMYRTDKRRVELQATCNL